MIIFTYSDYIKYIKFYPEFRTNLMTLSDNSEEYKIIDKEHDKIFKTIFEDKGEAANFINEALNLKNKITKNQLEKYNSSYITITFQGKEADIVYKIKGRNIFILIEHQSTVDYSMPFRILTYQMEIMRSAIDISKIKNKEYKMPVVIPIVLYTGKEKWDVAQTLKYKQEKLEETNVEPSKFNLVNISDLDKKVLIEKESFMSKVFILEKTKNSKEIVEALEEVIPKIKEDKKDLMKRIISLILIRKIGENKANELIERLKGEKKDMLAVLDMIDKENQMYINRRKSNR